MYSLCSLNYLECLRFVLYRLMHSVRACAQSVKNEMSEGFLDTKDLRSVDTDTDMREPCWSSA